MNIPSDEQRGMDVYRHAYRENISLMQTKLAYSIKIENGTKVLNFEF